MKDQVRKSPVWVAVYDQNHRRYEDDMESLVDAQAYLTTGMWNNTCHPVTIRCPDGTEAEWFHPDV